MRSVMAANSMLSTSRILTRPAKLRSVRICPECRTRTEERSCPQDGSPTLDEAVLTKSRVDPLIGEVFDDRYEVLARIGKGGMGSVYRARQLTMGREVALKVLNPDLAEDEEAAGRFVREAKVASRLRHPNTIVIHDFGHTAAGLFIAMELLEGEPLSDRLKRESALSPTEVARIASAVARSLDEAHHAGIVHRDLKPGNIFLNDVHGGGHLVKVLDFGVAKFAQDARTHESTDMFETQKPQILGTIAYMAPEQVNNGPLTNRTDLYALGVMMHRMLSGRLPFESDSPIVVLRMHLEEKPPELPRGVPGELSSLVRKMMAKAPSDRPESAAEVADVLDGWLERETGTVTDTEPEPVATETSPLAAPKSERRKRVPEAEWGAFEDTGDHMTSAVEAGRSVVGVSVETLPPSRPTVARSRERAAPRAGASRKSKSRWGPFFGLVLVAMLIAAVFAYIDMTEPGDVRDGVLELSSAPDGALVRDADTGKELGRTPLRFDKSSKPPERVIVSAPGRYAHTVEIRLPQDGRTVKQRVDLNGLPTIMVESTPEGASVMWLERRRLVGKTPTRLPDEAIHGKQNVTVVITLPGYNPRTVIRTPRERAEGARIKVKLTPGGSR